jgi:negative regulator of sigma E activity
MPCAKHSAAFALALAMLALAGAGGVRAFAATSAESRASQMLRQSMDAPKNISYIGQLETIRFSSNRANATIVRIEHRAPDMTRRWYLAPESLYGDYIITRGTATYQFDTKRSRVTVSHNPSLDNQVTANENLSRVMTNYRPVIAGSDIIAGRKTTSLILANKYTGERVMRVWLDAQTHLVLKKEEYHGNGSVASQTRFEELRYTNGIPDGIFSTDAPTGYTQVAGHDFAMPSSDIEKVIRDAGFTPITPKGLPQGFVLVSGDARTVNGVRTLHLVYSDGLRAISLFENAKGAAADFGALPPHTVRFEDHEGQYVEDGPTTLLTWKEKGLYFALVGDLLRNELIEIAKSVVP